jgi:hypothetical protein
MTLRMRAIGGSVALLFLALLSSWYLRPLAPIPTNPNAWTSHYLGHSIGFIGDHVVVCPANRWKPSIVYRVVVRAGTIAYPETGQTQEYAWLSPLSVVFRYPLGHYSYDPKLINGFIRGEYRPTDPSLFIIGSGPIPPGVYDERLPFPDHCRI